MPVLDASVLDDPSEDLDALRAVFGMSRARGGPLAPRTLPAAAPRKGEPGPAAARPRPVGAADPIRFKDKPHARAARDDASPLPARSRAC